MCGDIVKWLAYYGLFQFYHKSMDMLDQAVMSFSYGAAAAILGFMITYTVTAYRYTNSREEAEVRIGDETRERKLKKLYIQQAK